jgi:GNAT superfamily N-acetyltransferase
MRIRLFRKGDTDSVLELANKYAAFDGTTSEADLAVTAHFRRGFWVAEDEGEVVGFAYGYFREVPGEILERWRSSKVGQVELMTVHPEYRSSGVGRSLLSRLLKEFKTAGADMAILNCPASAPEARALYEDMGFDVKSYQMKKRL